MSDIEDLYVELGADPDACALGFERIAAKARLKFQTGIAPQSFRAGCKYGRPFGGRPVADPKRADAKLRRFD